MHAKTRRRARPGIVLPPVNRSSRVRSRAILVRAHVSAPPHTHARPTEPYPCEKCVSEQKSSLPWTDRATARLDAAAAAPCWKRSSDTAKNGARRGRLSLYGGRVSGADGPTRRSPAKSRRARRRATQRARGRAHRLTETQFTFHYLGPRREHGRDDRRCAVGRADRHRVG